MEDMVPFFFDYPTRKMRMIALTRNERQNHHHPCGSPRSAPCMDINRGIIRHPCLNRSIRKSPPTIPLLDDVIDLDRILSQMAKEGWNTCMEVSSHSLVLGRVAGCEFDDAVFTNLTEDQFNFHKTMDNYKGQGHSFPYGFFQRTDEEGQVLTR